jgi:DNA-directed RNA polymerase specialized sigma24 family protein
MSKASKAHTVAQHLPFLRRYARALTGSQTSGDAYVAATLEVLVKDPDLLDSAPGAGVFGVEALLSGHGICASQSGALL